MPVDRRRPRLGYLLAAVAALMFAVNGSIAKFLLDDGVSAVHLSQLRATLSFALLAGALVLADRSRLRIARADVARMAWLGIAGLALVQLTYFLAIDRLPISVALVIQFTGPLLVLLWLRVAHARRLKPSLYGAVALSVAGSALVVEVYDAGSLDGLGIAFAVAAAVTFALYLVGFERAGHRYDAFTTLTWGLGFATLFWVAASPPWTFPFEDFSGTRNLALALGVVLIGTLAPFLLNVSALRHGRRPGSGSSPRSSRCSRPRSPGRSTAKRWRRSRSRAACSWSPPSPGFRRIRRRPGSKPSRSSAP